GDRDRIIQVLTNLLANALKFSPKNSEVVIGVSCSDGNIRFAVTDHGPGIPEGEQAKLFVPFQQVDSSDSRTKGGTGLGLAISKAIVIKHGGRIGFDTKSGAGSTFWFELPIRQTLR
ncbi:MAG TPA: ATP-binding protein, partial [Candidatus Obscuribacterales bacterium]